MEYWFCAGSSLYKLLSVPLIVWLPMIQFELAQYLNQGEKVTSSAHLAHDEISNCKVQLSAV